MKTCPHKGLYVNAHCIISYNNPKLETTQLSNNWSMVYQFSNEKVKALF